MNPKEKQELSMVWVPVYRPNRRMMLSRVGPTFRRGHRFVSYCTTVFIRVYFKATCCCRQPTINCSPAAVYE